MKKGLWILTAGLLVLSACSAGKNKVIEPEYPKKIESGDLETWNQFKEANPVDEGFRQSLNQFAAQSASLILNNGENVNYSPVSLYLALALASEGAGGSSREQFMQILGAADQEEAYLLSQCGNLLRQIYAYEEPYLSFDIYNSLWLQEGYQWKEAFTKSALKEYYASLHQVDFQKDTAQRQMVNWIKETTNGYLEPSVQATEAQVMALMNAVNSPLAVRWI